MIVLLCLLGAASLWAADDSMAKGWDHFYNLEFDQAIAAFQSAVAKNPNDPYAYNALSQGILYREMLRSGSLESELVTGNNPFLKREKLKPSPVDRKLLEDSIATALQLTQATLDKSPDNIKALYAQGIAYGLRANYNFLVRKAWMDALRDITTSRKLQNQVTKLKPDYYDARLVQGVHDYVVGSLPWHYKILGFLIGFRGDKEEGIKTLQLVAEKGEQDRNDAKVILAAIYRRERRPADAIPLLKELLHTYPRNYLFLLEMVQMYADEGDKQKALETLAELEKRKRANTPGFAAMPEEKINVSRGNLLFWYRDYDYAISELEKAVRNVNDLDLNASTTAYLRLGQCYDMKGERAEALKAYRGCMDLAPDSDAAGQARKYLSSPYKRGKE
ncbi:MAG: tetratricopeptide repeat protein [Bryobacterales bacterium]|nr:tetratricopeptide repeat protein [Bryobacterales bacterium]